MGIETVIDNIITFQQDTDTYKDHRCRIDLLYKLDDTRMDVLISPHGSDLKSKKDVKIYVRFLADGSSEHTAFKDMTVEDIFKSDGKKYMVLRGKRKDFVLPYTAKGNFPFRIMPGEFTNRIAESNDETIGRFIKILELMYDIDNKKTDAKTTDLFKEYKDMVNGILQMYDGLRKPIFEAFADVDGSNLALLPRTSRQFKHWPIKDARSKIVNKDKVREILAKRMMNSLIVSPLKHAYYSTEDNRLFGVSREIEAIESHKIFASMLKDESPKAYEAWRTVPKSSQRTGARLYHTYMLLGSVGALIAGNVPLAIGLFTYQLMERTVSKHNQRNTGYNTGIIGTIRDKTGLYKVVQNPMDMISEDYKLGFWRRSDLD
jgi:uncharacterized protein YfbU (UPF0304 family)